jgi:hypothetical protein
MIVSGVTGWLESGSCVTYAARLVTDGILALPDFLQIFSMSPHKKAREDANHAIVGRSLLCGSYPVMMIVRDRSPVARVL